ncbi:Hpt domain-containing protein [Azomonas macrocytogenes]|uniref:HPt (Histidine-containing phosphotransfer) domain-containing protein n=1 Tax=Azomonas macrocytogenes TaxID=69962 RepID=A0A839T1K6_AZOMA|nr:Hpt domain-containing protein [Azomonas macrocytogenes]MBB3101835.1 HPt (histidine-containing phosphotransfer) domain-containing protein [Azomonas macrocytogenes]
MPDVHLDDSTLNNLKLIMGDRLAALVDTYVADSENRLKLLEEAYTDQQLGELRRLAHSLKGSSSNMGASSLANLCHTLEQLARDAEVSDIAQIVERIQREFMVVRELLKGL